MEANPTTHLIENTAFGKKTKEDYFNGFISLPDYRERRDKYDEFLSKPLELSFFIPCKDGKILSEPEIYSQWISENRNDDLESEEEIKKCKDYLEAKELCLFEGFEKIQVTEYDFRVRTKGMKTYVFWSNNNLNWNTSEMGKTIEHLVKYNLILSESAKKSLL